MNFDRQKSITSFSIFKPSTIIQHPSVQKEQSAVVPEVQLEKPSRLNYSIGRITISSVTPIVQCQKESQEETLQTKCESCDKEEQVQRSIDGVAQLQPDLESQPLIQLQQPPQATPLQQPPQATPTIPNRYPVRALTWDDFKGTPPKSSFGAETRWRIEHQKIQGKVFLLAKFQPRLSWVLPKYKAPNNRQLNGGQKEVKECEKLFKENPETSNVSFTYSPDSNCPDAIFPPDITVDSKKDCEKIGQGIDAALQQDSITRLLSHENIHFKIASDLVAKANVRISNGEKLGVVEKDLESQQDALQEQYDTETNHGCIGKPQAQWKANYP